ncbi:hypothetical protein [Azospirillum sp. sgz302134]
MDQITLGGHSFDAFKVLIVTGGFGPILLALGAIFWPRHRDKPCGTAPDPNTTDDGAGI